MPSGGVPASTQPFTWECIHQVWRYDQQHAECKRTSMRRDAVYRDGFSDLRVGIALAPLDKRVLASIRAIAKTLEAGDVADRVSSQ